MEDGDLCAVEIAVRSPGGAPFRGATIRVLDAKGTYEFETKSGDDGTARICDFGFGPHEIIVSPRSCFPVRFKVDRVLERHPIRLEATLNPCPVYPNDRDYCIAYFRVTSQEGTPIASASIEPPIVPLPQSTDRYGRVWVYLPSGWSKSLSVVASGYLPKAVTVNCRSTEVVEKPVVLERAK